MSKFKNQVIEREEGEQFALDFKSIINQYDRTVVKALMPFMVNILDCMNVGYKEKLEYEAKLQKIIKESASIQNKEKRAKKVLKEALQDYISKYEKERESRAFLEKKLSEFEKRKEKDGKAVNARVEALEVHVQTLEKKFKLSCDCIKRLEEREDYLKKEYSSLLEKYTQLFREHVEYLQKTKRPNTLLTEGNIELKKSKEEVVEHSETEPCDDQNDTDHTTEEEVSEDKESYKENVKQLKSMKVNYGIQFEGDKSRRKNPDYSPLLSFYQQELKAPLNEDRNKQQKQRELHYKKPYVEEPFNNEVYPQKNYESFDNEYFDISNDRVAPEQVYQQQNQEYTREEYTREEYPREDEAQQQQYESDDGENEFGIEELNMDNPGLNEQVAEVAFGENLS